MFWDLSLLKGVPYCNTRMRKRPRVDENNVKFPSRLVDAVDHDALVVQMDGGQSDG